MERWMKVRGPRLLSRHSLLTHSLPRQHVYNGPSNLFAAAADHPMWTLALVAASWVGMWYTLKWCMQPIAPEVANAKYD